MCCLSCRRSAEASCGPGSTQGLWHRFCGLSARRGSGPSAAAPVGGRCHQTRAKALPHSLSCHQSYHPPTAIIFYFCKLVAFLYDFLACTMARRTAGLASLPSRQLCCKDKVVLRDSYVDRGTLEPWVLKAALGHTPLPKVPCLSPLHYMSLPVHLYWSFGSPGPLAGPVHVLLMCY